MEYPNSGITFQKLSPGLVVTKMTDFNKEAQQSKLLSTDPENFARNAVRTLGVTDATTGYWKHGINVSNLNSRLLRYSLFCLVNKQLRTLSSYYNSKV